MVAPITASNRERVCERGGGGGGRGNWLQNVLKTRTADGKPSAIAIDPSLEPAPNRCCFKRFFISVLLLLLLLSNFGVTHGACGGLPVLPLLFPGCAQSRIPNLCSAAGRIRFPPKTRRWGGGGGGPWSGRGLLERLHAAATAAEEVLFL